MVGFESIYVEHFRGVYRYVCTLCHDEILAEEITQEAFFKALESLDKFDGKCHLFVWLCQIAKNTYFSYLKRKKIQSEHSASNYLSFSTDSLEDKITDQDAAQNIHRLIHTLKDPYKEVFLLRVYAELSFAHIGKIFDKSDSWARLVYYRAKNELRRKWDENTL